MKKRLTVIFTVIFGVASGLFLVGLVVVIWFQIISNRMESPALTTLAFIFLGGLIVCVLVSAILMLMEQSSGDDQGGDSTSGDIGGRGMWG